MPAPYLDELAVCSQLMAAQSMLYVLPDEAKLCDFVQSALYNIPAVQECSLCINALGAVVGDRTETADQLHKRLHSTPEDFDPVGFSSQLSETQALFPLQTAASTYGYVLVRRDLSLSSRNLTSILANFLNVVALDLERRRQQAKLTAHHEELTETVRRRTLALQKEITAKNQATHELAWELGINQTLAALANQLILPNDDITSTARLILEHARDLTGSKHGFVSEIDRFTGENVCHTLTAMMGEECQVKGYDARIAFPAEVDGAFSSLWGHGINSKLPFYSNAPKTHPYSRGIPEGHVPIHCFLSVPVIYSDEIVGQIALANPTEPYCDRQLDVIQRLANLYALAIRRKRIEEDQRLIESRSQQISRMVSIGEMASGVAHEINNPINGVINYAQMLLNDLQATSGRQTEILQRLIRESNRIATIVKSLLGAARHDELKHQPVQLEDVLSDALHLFQKMLEKDGIELTLDIAPELPPVKGDPHQLSQVINNLISNARHALNQKAFPVGEGKRLTISLATTSKPIEDIIQLRVHDNGTGIPSEVQGKIFIPFFTTKPSSQGTGLGLSIVHNILAQHDAVVQVRSQMEQYTEFIIEFRCFSLNNGSLTAVDQRKN